MTIKKPNGGKPMYYTNKQVAEMANCSSRTVHRHLIADQSKSDEKKSFPNAFLVSSHMWLIPTAEAEKFIEERKNKGH